MPDILIRGLKAITVERLKARAKANGRSLQGEARLALEQAAGLTFAEVRKLARESQEQLAGRQFSNSAELQREDRER
jgi:plasmid stability protein